MKCQVKVALRKESVDRNVNLRVLDGSKSVALRKESVDRNIIIFVRRCYHGVALRKESVDRNPLSLLPLQHLLRRSPQGERG